MIFECMETKKFFEINYLKINYENEEIFLNVNQNILLRLKINLIFQVLILQFTLIVIMKMKKFRFKCEPKHTFKTNENEEISF